MGGVEGKGSCGVFAEGQREKQCKSEWWKAGGVEMKIWLVGSRFDGTYREAVHSSGLSKAKPSGARYFFRHPIEGNSLAPKLLAIACTLRM